MSEKGRKLDGNWTLPRQDWSSDAVQLLIFAGAWNSATREWLEAKGWGPTLYRSGFNV
jgi:hypothetical protein